MRKELLRWVRRLKHQIHIASLLVAHYQEAALEVADRFAILTRGLLEQVDSPEEVYAHPATPFVIGFLKDVTILHGRTVAKPAESEAPK